MPEAIDGKYEVLDELARGGMGVVYRARELSSGREVALKLIKARKLSDRKIERFRREAELAGNLDHPGIVRVHAAGDHGGQPYMVQELVEGARSLKELFRERALPERVAWVLEAARAVAHAHAHGVVHRDLKPANLLVGADGRLRVADFGLAWRADLDRLTKTGELAGTPTHMAPEQFEGESGDATVDVWALGVLLYEALTGDLPFQGATFMELAAKIDAAAPTPPRAISGESSPAVERVCLRALQRQGVARYPDAGAFADALEAALGAPVRSRTGPAVGVLACALLAVVLWGLAQALSEPEPSPDLPEPSATGGERPASPTASARPTRRPAQHRPLSLLCRVRAARREKPQWARFLDERRFLLWFPGRLREYRLRERDGQTAVDLLRSVELPPALRPVGDPREAKLDLLGGGGQPWLHTERSLKELFRASTFRPRRDLQRDISLSFFPWQIDRVLTARGPRYALLQKTSPPQVHVIRQGRVSQAVSEARVVVEYDAVDRIALAPDAKHLAVAEDVPSFGGVLHIYALPSGKHLRSERLGASLKLLAFRARSDLVVAGSKAGVVVLVPVDGSPLTNLTPTEGTAKVGLTSAVSGPVRTGTFTADGRTLLTLSDRDREGGERQLHCWDVAAGELLPAQLDLGRSRPHSLVCSPGGTYLLLLSGAGVEVRALTGVGRR